MPNKIMRLKRNHLALVVIDIQEKLVPAIFEKERVVQNSAKLARAAAALNVSALVTEQYRKGLGGTVAEVASAVAGFAPIDKVVFSTCGAAAFVDALRATGATQVVLCGMEAHVCVLQSCLDLLEQGVDVFVAADAISSRTPENWRLGVDRMRDSGACIISTEMMIFELLGCAGTDEFKRVMPLIK